MYEFSRLIKKSLTELVGQNIQIICDESSISGLLSSFKSHQYFYQLKLKNGNRIKKYILFYPFNFEIKKDILFFDYRYSLLKKLFSKELIYSISEIKNSSQILNNIIYIKKYAVESNSKLSVKVDS